MARIAALCVLAAAAWLGRMVESFVRAGVVCSSCSESKPAQALCMLRNIAFVSAPARTTADPAVAAGAAVLATVPMGADAFVFKGSLFCRKSFAAG